MYVVPVAKCRARCQMLCAMPKFWVPLSKNVVCVTKCVRYQMLYALPNVRYQMLCVAKSCVRCQILYALPSCEHCAVSGNNTIWTLVSAIWLHSEYSVQK